MKVIAINGSPRKNWNTATRLKNVLSGAKSAGAETEIVHLYDLDFAAISAAWPANYARSLIPAAVYCAMT